MINRNEIINVGVAGALDEIGQRIQAYEQAEIRLREKLKPAALRPLNFTHRNGRAASNAAIESIRRAGREMKSKPPFYQNFSYLPLPLPPSP